VKEGEGAIVAVVVRGLKGCGCCVALPISSTHPMWCGPLLYYYYYYYYRSPLFPLKTSTSTIYSFFSLSLSARRSAFLIAWQQ